MSSRKMYRVLAAISCLCIALLYVGFLKPKIDGQPNPAEQINSEIRSEPRAFNFVRDVQAKNSSPNGEESSTDWSAAAAENARLQRELGWTFGGKTQRGWYLYIPLIQQTVGSDADSDSIEFAGKVAGWQQKMKLQPTGIIDEQTLVGFVRWWQSRRLNSSVYPSDDKLLVAPVSVFYDPAREEPLRKVERETFDAYKKMVAAALADKSLNLRGTGDEFAPGERFLKIVSAFRSREYQENLRRKSPNSGSAGLAVNSPHFTGCAIDVYVGGDPVETKDENRAVQVRTPVYKWLVKNAERFGFFPYYYEPWHWEYVGENGKRKMENGK